MIKYVATVKIKGANLNRTIEATAYKSDYMSDYDLYDSEKELKKEIKKLQKNLWNYLLLGMENMNFKGEKFWKVLFF